MQPLDHPLLASTPPTAIVPISIALGLQLLLVGAAGAYSDVAFFGDSFTDTGNTCATVASNGEGFAPSRCSNGPVWSDRFVAALGLGSEATSSASGGSNDSNGGARSIDLASQIDAYTTASGGAADPDALHVVWLGGNDILFDVILPSGGPGVMQAAAERIGAGVEALDDVLDSVTVASLTLFDATTSFGAIIDGPAAFGFSRDAIDATTQANPFPVACLVDPVCAADPKGPVADGFLIFDSVHPTTALHALIAEEALATVVPEPTTALCVGLGLIMLARRSRCRPAPAAGARERSRPGLRGMERGTFVPRRRGPAPEPILRA